MDILLVLTASFFASKTIAQEHTNSWFRTTVSIPVKEKIKTDIELQHRRQNDFESDNLFDKNLMSAFRTWIYYKQNKDVVYGISPFAYFSNYKSIQKESDAFTKPSTEYRFTASIELQHELATKFYVVDRTAIEYRAFEGAIENTTRLRNRLAFRYDFNPEYNLAMGDEILINSSGTDAQHLFDHNRIFTNFSYKPNSIIKFDIGYIYISRLTKNATDLIDESNFYLNFTYSISNK
ncbi:DUF2490 domain-containing protein [Flavobacterium sp. NST-5]|uniref:DUF2490 domain-containing protein n=1 Tax=Flavobacterium ichthyis TaxID=2698827 RepID=A0ABW9Z8F9_9FLAO|nr:DUF2490 domain-containing protein [Flavobacterium ichthyis]NBL65147.1 DUF2490 domain-containing protein [Flavobacterium ichthyis]